MDDRVRDLERAAHDGDVESTARLLWERVRKGELEAERLRLAAYVGDAAARLALGAGAPETPADATKLVRGLEDWGKDALVRAALAAAASVLHLTSADAVFRERVRQALSALCAWLAAAPDGREPLEAAVEEARGVLPIEPSVARSPEGNAYEALRHALAMATARGRTAPARDAVRVALRALTDEQRADDPAAELLEVLRDALASWALGGLDPVARLGALDPRIWHPPAGPGPLPRTLERGSHGDFVLDRAIDGRRWLMLVHAGRRRLLAPFAVRAGERARCFATSSDGRVTAWARTSRDGEFVDVRVFDRGVGREHQLAAPGRVEDLAVSPSGERVVWVSGHDDASDRLWHLDLRVAQPEAVNVVTEHAALRALHFPTHCAVGFITDRAAWDACAPEERKGALLERHLVRMELLS